MTSRMDRVTTQHIKQALNHLKTVLSNGTYDKYRSKTYCVEFSARHFAPKIVFSEAYNLAHRVQTSPPDFHTYDVIPRLERSGFQVIRCPNKPECKGLGD